MIGQSLLFVTGIARSGTTLLAQVLNAHPQVAVALDPYLPLLRSYRNAAIRAGCDASTAARFVDAPLQDYFFSDERLAVMDAVQAGTLSLPFEQEERNGLLASIERRASIEAPDVVPLLAKLDGKTYRDLFERALSLVAEARAADGKRWIGFKEVWCIEFCKALAAAYADAKFIVIMRDPRAVVASMHALAAKDATQRAHALSYARHWRKFVAFCEHYGADPRIRGRLLVVRYEDLAKRPAVVVPQLCAFLDIDFVPPMILDERDEDRAGQRAWQNNSSYEGATSGIDATLIDRWRGRVDPGAHRMVELVCGAEMQHLGYSVDNQGAKGDPAILEFLVSDAAADCSWRSDLGDPVRDYQAELDRLSLLGGGESISDRRLLRRNFLFDDMFEVLREQPATEGARQSAMRQ